MNLNDPSIKFILGRPNFWCGNVAQLLRGVGHTIERKAEEEQAYVINYMLELYEKHGENWEESLLAELHKKRGYVSEAPKQLELPLEGGGV